MRFVWEAIDALLKRNVNSVKAFYYGNLPSSEEVKVENSNEEISAPETTPKASAETIIEEFKQAEAAQEPVLETKNELEEQMLQLAKNLKTVPQEKVLGFINFISHFVDENNDLKTENKKLKAQHRQDEYLIEKYDENLKDVANKLESLQQEVQLLRYEARKAGLSLDNKSNNQVTLDNTGMVVDYK
jgi:predicted metal-dependent hydrolase